MRARADADADGRVVVSVHDVAPRQLASVRWLLGRLDDLGVVARVLKVIPVEAGGVAVGADPGLVALLRGEVSRGAEVVLHGYAHVAAGPLHGSRLDRARAALFAAGSAEFLGLTRDEAAERVRAGLAALDDLGIRPLGFCPPAWLVDRHVPGVLRECGLRYFLTFGALHDLARRSRRTIPAVGYMGAGPVQERLVAVERLFVQALVPALPVVRLFLHPQGAERSTACAAVLHALERMLATRRPVTYAALLDA